MYEPRTRENWFKIKRKSIIIPVRAWAVDDHRSVGKVGVADVGDRRLILSASGHRYRPRGRRPPHSEDGNEAQVKRDEAAMTSDCKRQSAYKQHPISMGTKESMSHGACGAGAAKCARNRPKIVSKLTHRHWHCRPSGPAPAGAGRSMHSAPVGQGEVVPEAGNRSYHRIASTSQRPMSMRTK